MTSSLHAPARRVLVRHLLALAVAGASGCGGAVESAPSNEGGAPGSATTAGGSTSSSTSTGSSAGEGGAPTSSSGGDGAGAAGAGGAGPDCDGAIEGSPCDVEGTSCEEIIGQGICEQGMPRITACTGGRWETWTSISCGPFVPDPACAVVGRWRVEPTGPLDPADTSLGDHGGPFELSLQVRDDARLYASARGGSFDPASCTVEAYWVLDESCEVEDGQDLCTTIERRIALSMLEEPASGTVELSCWGECDESATAPVEGTRLED